jgi:hypothetical protein
VSRADIKMAEDFRLQSVHFSQLPWKTSVLCRPGGLEELNDAVEISVRLAIRHILASKTAENLRQKLIRGIQEDEQALWMETMHSGELVLRGLTKPRRPPPGSLRALANVFCFEGSMPPNKKDIIVKELLKYRLVDMFAYTREGMVGFDGSKVAVLRQRVVQAAPQLVRLAFIFSVSQSSTLLSLGPCKDVQLANGSARRSCCNGN